MRILGAAALALLASPRAQVRLDLRLAPDPAHRGPPGLVFARTQLARFGVGDIDPDAGVLLAVDSDGVVAHADAAPIATGVYLEGRITTARGTIAVQCDDSGRETWRGGAAAFDAEPLRAFAASTDVARPLGKTAWLDVAVLVGVLGTGIETESPIGLLLTLGAAECGELIVRASRADDELVYEGRSRGGLTLPALLTALARRHSASPLPDEDRWIALAFAARDSRREEAALQLARFPSAASERCLLALLHGQDFVRTCALEALARRRAGGALPEMAATAAFADRDPVALAALVTLWPTCSADQRRRTRAELAANPALLDALDDAGAPHRPRGAGAVDTGPTRGAGSDWRRRAALLVLTLSALGLFWRVRAERRARTIG